MYWTIPVNLTRIESFKGREIQIKLWEALHSSPKFSLPHHLLTAGLIQKFLFCLNCTYLCALESTRLPCLLATLCWCRRDRENSVLSAMGLSLSLD